MQLVRADFYNPFAQFIYKITNPPLLPLRKIIPKLGNLELSAVLLALILQALELVTIFYIKGFTMTLSVTAIGGLFLRGAGELLDIVFVIYLFASFMLLIFSWMQPGRYNPVISVLAQVVEPVYKPIRNRLPSIGSLDITPMLVIFLLILCRILISDPIINFGSMLILTG
jgi:YggT family protein